MATDNNSGGGLIGAGTAVATKAIGVLGGAPMLLVLMLLNIGMFSMMTYLILSSAEYRFKERAELIKLLDTCMVAVERRDRGMRNDGNSSHAIKPAENSSDHLKQLDKSVERLPK